MSIRQLKDKGYKLFKLSVAELQCVEDELGIEDFRGCFYVFLNPTEREALKELKEEK